MSGNHDSCGVLRSCLSTNKNRGGGFRPLPMRSVLIGQKIFPFSIVRLILVCFFIWNRGVFHASLIGIEVSKHLASEIVHDRLLGFSPPSRPLNVRGGEGREGAFAPSPLIRSLFWPVRFELIDSLDFRIVVFAPTGVACGFQPQSTVLPYILDVLELHQDFSGMEGFNHRIPTLRVMILTKNIHSVHKCYLFFRGGSDPRCVDIDRVALHVVNSRE